MASARRKARGTPDLLLPIREKPAKLREIMSILSQPKVLTGKALTEALEIRKLPKVLLHEHLDGGLRPSTVVDLAAESAYKGLPTTDPGDLAKWFHRGAQRGNLLEYLEGFQHTISVMQTPEALERIAFEFIEDMYDDGVVYAEVRFAPVYHIARGLTQDEVVAAVINGLERGERTYGVEFPMMEKTSVVPGKANPVFERLTKLTGEAPEWNFHKYLLSRDGKRAVSIAARTKPENADVVKKIEELLAEK